MRWTRMEDVEEEEFERRWEDKDVVFSDDEEGSIEDVIEDENGNPVMLQVNTPGVLGTMLGGRSVLVPMELVTDEDEDNIYLDINTDEANNLPEVDEDTPITENLVNRVYRNLDRMGIRTGRGTEMEERRTRMRRY